MVDLKARNSNFVVVYETADGLSIPEKEKESYEWLQEREKPDGLAVYGVSYSGPLIAK